MKNDAIFRVQEMNTHLPFAVVGSNEFVKVGNKNLRARQYPWGVVQVRPWNRGGREQFLFTFCFHIPVL
jgi:septin family protein